MLIICIKLFCSDLLLSFWTILYIGNIIQARTVKLALAVDFAAIHWITNFTPTLDQVIMVSGLIFGNVALITVLP